MAGCLAFDYGSQRIGVAIGGGKLGRPEPLAILSNDQHSMHEIQNLINQHRPTKLIVGLPHNLDGEETAQSAECRTFARSLEDFNLPVIVYDESLSSERAEHRLGLVSLRKKKRQLDAISAQIILEDYLAHATK